MWAGEWSHPLLFSLSPGRVHLPFRQLEEPLEDSERKRRIKNACCGVILVSLDFTGSTPICTSEWLQIQ